MRFAISGLLLLAALNVAQAQENPPPDPASGRQMIEIVRASDLSDLSEAATSEQSLVLTGENVNTLALGRTRYDLSFMVTLAYASAAAGSDNGLPDEARIQFSDLDQIPADRPRSIAFALDRLQRLQDAYTRLDRLDEAAAIREKLEACKARQSGAHPAPRNLTAYRGQIGKTLRFTVTGRADSPVWGDGLYTDDSALAAAAVHAGAVREGQTGVVKVTMVDGQAHYTGAEQHGVVSQSYENWDGSYRVEAENAPAAPASAAPKDALPQAAKDLLAKLAQSKNEIGSRAQVRDGLNALRNMEISCAENTLLDAALSIRDARLRFVGENVGAIPDPGPLTGYRAKAGQTFYFYVQGHAPGSVWGDGIYTDDSALGAVAVHAGLLRRGQKGLVKVTFLPGRESYEGAERNGVGSQPYAAWQGSYRVEAAPF